MDNLDKMIDEVFGLEGQKDSMVSLPVNGTVEETLKANPTVIFHIGSSSGFFFIGDYEEWCRNGDKISKDAKKEHAQRTNAARMKIPQTLKSLEDLCKANTINRTACTRAMGILNKNINIVTTHWVPVGKRIPVKRYLRTQGDGQILIVDGVEMGRFWSKSDYDTSYGVSR